MKIFLTTENDFQNINDLVTLSKISVFDSLNISGHSHFNLDKAVSILLDNIVILMFIKYL